MKHTLRLTLAAACAVPVPGDLVRLVHGEAAPDDDGRRHRHRRRRDEGDDREGRREPGTQAHGRAAR